MTRPAAWIAWRPSAVPGARAGRGLLAALAATCVVAGGLAMRADHRCAGTLSASLRLSAATPAAQARALARDAAARCDSPGAVRVAVRLSANGRRADAAAVARALARRSPQDYLGWFALASLTPDPAEAGAARRRAALLKPDLARAPR